MIGLAAMWAATGAAGCSHLTPIDPTQLRAEDREEEAVGQLLDTDD